MTLTNPKPLGWAFGEILTSAQMNSFGTQLTRALDGTGGGSYTLTNPLVLAGDVVEFDDVVINDDLTVDDDALVSGDLTVGGSLSLVGTAFLGTVAASSVSTGALTASGATALNGNVTLGNSGTDLTTLAGILGFTGTGRVQMTGTVHPNANTAVDVAASRWNSAAPSGSAKSYTLSCTNEADGDWFAFYNNNGSENVLLAGLIVLAVVPNRGVFYMRIGGVWTFLFAWVSV
jgi:hypothetical protein